MSTDLDIFVDSPSGSTSDRPPTSMPRGWAGWVLIAIAIVVAAFIFRGCDSANIFVDDDSTVVDLPVDGACVMLVYDTEADDDWSQDRRAILTAPEVLEWYRDNLAKVDGLEAYRAFTTKQIAGGLQNENKVWRELSKAITLNAPSVIIGAGRKARQFELAEDADAHLRTLNRAIRQVKR